MNREVFTTSGTYKMVGDW